ncbi:M23 family metallopeptidase [Oleiagrimonas sp. C23AA]|uniref:M23 family metallopeptidase n=1 Tax=Oleiagrimonas sp. C23AA TaxID=2719047 RepID=UPI0014218DBF|nr:M23 family metallopeptidase [Oleiagrimonas sp. C23AA]NII10189.1 M23 family metallopeptidase [Oleiagrimonas sp. C23AA]
MKFAGACLVAAFAVVAGAAGATPARNINIKWNTGAAPALPQPKCVLHRVTVTRGDSAYTLLRDAGVDAGSVMRWLSQPTDAHVLRRMRPGDALSFCAAQTLGGGTHLTSLKLIHDQASQALSAPRPHAERGLVTVGFTIRHSLARELRHQHVSSALAMAVHEYLAHDRDLPTHLPAGARIKAIFSGAPSHARSRLLCLDVTLHKHHHRIYHYVDGKGAQYLVGSHGHGVRMLAMIKPLPHARISSGWGWRINPVLKRREFHKGIDYAAPLGTPIRAAMTGTVDMARWHGNYGRLVEIRSSHGVVTRYGHLHRMAHGIHNGVHVHAGEVIGYVGSTGLSTGPHLYFELWEHHKRINPLVHRPAISASLSRKDRHRFSAYVHTLAEQVPLS